MIFLSYSRREFHFAESLAIRLQHNGISVWFDAQQIAAGEDWSAEIQAGLINATGVVLVASNASLSSPYVALEWQHALENHKPVHVVMFEAVQLPPELLSSAASVIDFRSDFDKELPRLVQAIQQPNNVRDPLPRARLFGLPTRLPRAILLVEIALMMTTILKVAAILMLVSAVSALQAALLLPNLLLLYMPFVHAFFFFRAFFAWRPFIRRSFVYADIEPSRLEFVSIQLIVISLLGWILGLFGDRGQLPAMYYIYYGLVLAYVAYWRFILRPVAQHPDVLRWCPLAVNVPVEWRAVVHRPYLDPALDIQLSPSAVVGREERFIPAVITVANVDLSGKTFRLYHAPPDKVSQLKAALESLGLREATDSVDYHLLFLTFRTPKELAYRLSAEHPNLICVLGSSINLPTDAPDSFRGVQWVDYREGSDEALQAAFRALVYASDVRHAAVQALNTLPPALSRYHFDGGLATPYYWFGNAGGGCLMRAVPMAIILMAAITAGVNSLWVILTGLCILALLLNTVYFYRVAWQTGSYRPINRRNVWRGLLVGGALLVIAAFLETRLAAELTSASNVPAFEAGQVVMLIVLMFAWALLVWMVKGFGSRDQDVFTPDPGAFGAPPMRPQWRFFIEQGFLIALVLFFARFFPYSIIWPP